jgi:rod shape-determining protein MreD
MGNFLGIPILAIAASLQASFVPQIRLLGGGPDLVFLFVLAWAINSRLEDGVLWAFAGGIMLDLLSYNPTGTSALGMLLLVFAISGLEQRVYRLGFFLLVGLVLIGTIVQQFLVMLILTLNGYPVNWSVGLTYVMAPTIFYNMVLFWPIFWFARRFWRRLERTD